jgi:hypothetical protein
MSTHLSSAANFARAPLAWGLAMAALYFPLAFFEPIIAPPAPNCTDWLWCDDAYTGLVVQAPSPGNLIALIAIPNALLAYWAAHIAGAAPTRRHWFMAGPLLALVGACAFAIWPHSPIWFWIDNSASDPIAVLVVGLEIGVMLGLWLGLPVALLTLLGALLWRALRPRRSA